MGHGEARASPGVRLPRATPPAENRVARGRLRGWSRIPRLLTKDLVHLEPNFTRPVCSLSTSLSLCLASAARAWCQVAQKFTGGIGNKLCGEWWRAGEKGGQGRGLALAERVAEPRLQMGGDAGARPSPANQAPRSVSLYSSALWRF